MNQDIDLTILLKNHIGETFWSPAFGDIELVEIHHRSGERPMLKFRTPSGNCRNFTPHGCIGYEYEPHGECIVWPSKENQDWGKWGERTNKSKSQILKELYNKYIRFQNPCINIGIEVSEVNFLGENFVYLVLQGNIKNSEMYIKLLFMSHYFLGDIPELKKEDLCPKVIAIEYSGKIYKSQEPKDFREKYL